MNCKILLSVVVIFTFMGCGSSGEDSKSTSPIIRGKVIDDYIKGANVCIDSNSNGEYDKGEECVVTNKQGDFVFTKRNKRAINSPFVVYGGVDIGTGKSFNGFFTAPANTKVISVFSTVIQSLVKKGNDVKKAEKIVKAKLEIDDSIDIRSFDPFKELEHNKDLKVKEKAKKVLAKQNKLQTILTIASRTVAGSSTKVTEKDVSKKVSSQLAILMLEAKAVIDSQESIAKVIDNSAKEVQKELINKAKEALSKAKDSEAKAKAETDIQNANKIAENVKKTTDLVALKAHQTAKLVEEKIEQTDLKVTDGLSIIKESNNILSVTENIADIAKDVVENKKDTTTLTIIDVENEISIIVIPDRLETTLIEDDVIIIPSTGASGAGN